MEKLNKAVLFLAIIDTMLEVLQGDEVDQTELVDSLAMVGLDPIEIMYDTHTILAFQKVCKEFAELDITEDELSALSQE
ncbi:hypothetical protein RE628_17785 [Paenibacillus sp. D2_2]|uniref:hypothetical protein n=1 Tax=Paenibacillus sp. D2_2 TaxID=3073092 RepID=UPI00281684FB|nr:hypothetical protein [Paenibacillus sp. D2_2]WMT39304.1 hypothetical protein RE628_17785 [Paenibacillus sp. D2_2]